MMAAVLREFGQPLEITDWPDPRPGPRDAIVRVMACGIDGTDLKLLGGFGYTPELPFIMGHEPAGVVEEIGSEVTEVRCGDRVVPYIFMIPPGSPWYGSPSEQLCPEMTGVIGVKNVPGGYAERLRVPAAQLTRLPDSIAWADAAVLCDAGLTAWHAVRRAQLESGEAVLVIGVGGVGSFVVQFARLAGAEVIAVEKHVAKLDWARSLGAERVIDGCQEDVPQCARQLAGAGGVDCVLDVVGSAESIAWAIESLRPGGRLVLVGYTPDAYPLSPKRFAQNEWRLIGSRGGTRRDLQAVVDQVAAGRVRSIVTRSRRLLEVNEALTSLREGQVLGRTVLEVHSPDTTR
ncbi:MAG: zinc-binding dehydrogenase [Pirellulales bacterium]|nr:zinc-binding dehydrogenase [Pirellulales bacterium]